MQSMGKEKTPLIEKKIEKEFYVCDSCGYDKGFHVSFHRLEQNCEVVLICPQCGQRYKINWRVNLD